MNFPELSRNKREPQDADSVPLLVAFGGHGNDVDLDTQFVIAGADEDTINRRNVVKIAADREADMVGAGLDGVGRIEAGPAVMRAAPNGNPGMGRIRALQPRLAGRRYGAQIAADVSGRQAEPAQA